MRRLLLTFTVGIPLLIGLAACGGGASTPTAGAGGGETEATAAAATGANALQPDVPIMEGALDMSVTQNGTVIKYQAPGTIEDATKFYQDQLEANGWERVNKVDSGFGDSITLLRKKENQTISVTLQSIAGSQNVRVLITLTPK